MTREEYKAAAENVIYLSACMVNNEKPDAKRVTEMDLKHLFAVAEGHLLTGIVGYALEAACVRDTAFVQAKSKAIRKQVLLDTERKAILEKLENAGVWYALLKGCVLKDLYPEIGMRQMSDNDILFDAGRADDVKAIMKSLGYKAECFNMGVHDSYTKPPVCHFEMHRALLRTGFDENLRRYYQNAESRLVKGPSCERFFSPEDFYLYLVAHEYKHYVTGGTGLRSLLDIYLYLRENRLDMGYVTAEAQKMGIEVFEKQNRSLACHLFRGEDLTEDEQKMLDYILSSGTYGTFFHRVTNAMEKKNWSKARYALHRFFTPVSRKNPDYDDYAANYPFFYRHKILLPLLPFYRLFRAILSGRFMSEAKAIRDVKKRRE